MKNNIICKIKGGFTFNYKYDFNFTQNNMLHYNYTQNYINNMNLIQIIRIYIILK